ncbi:hypothetical protein SAMN05443549_101420 [Flavobacterium fluvii]|uniref:DUF5689 domain-containing protein n=1 Tax=Flavobacterium fluvii TaxID=468056 RepID=A0A1M5EPD2_9FLAO|nr:DUF5689 domain-containing protein [Flavobacterium fluvii]SHF81004.1 hypothetical protein SAMN05443549_101420 [Flavobacterium fluvii]
MKNKIKNSCIIAMSIGLFSGCVNDTYDTPKFDTCVDPGLTKTKEVSQIYAVAINPVATPPSVVPNTPTYTADDIIEAYVISSDEGGNFYKSMYFQPTDGSKGFNLSVDEVNLYTKNFQPGKKVFLKMKGLAYGNPTDFGVGLIFGAKPTEQYDVDRLPTQEYPKHLIASCNSVSEDAIVHKITIAQAVSGAAFLNTLVEIDNVQFTDEAAGGTYDSNRDDDFDSSIFVTNGTTNLTVRTSRFANFAGYKVPTGKGKIRGVLTKYNSTYQIILRTERDVNMPNPRVDYTPALVGVNSTVFPATVNETFESYTSTPQQSNFPNYINDAAVGSRYWAVTTFGGNKYIQMTSFGSGGANNAYLFVPVNMTTASNFSFRSCMGFWVGAVLKVYYVLATDYTPGGKIDVAKMTNITSNFTIPTTPTSGYGATFTASGNYAIPATLTGNGYFVFEYAGNANASPALTTTLQLDNILIN